MYKFVLGFCLFFSLSAGAQQPFWVQTNGPSGGDSQFEFNSKGDIFNIGRNFLRSTDDGVSWKNITPAFLSRGLYGWGISPHDDLYLLTDSLLYRSQDNGDTWSIVLKDVLYGSVITSKTGSIYVVNTKIGGYLWRSVDDGNTWANITTQMPQITNSSYLSITPTGKLIFFNSNDSDFYFSINNGNSWTKQSTLPFKISTKTIRGTENGYLFCDYATQATGTDFSNGFVIRSTDNGVTWDSINKCTFFIIASNDVLLEIVGFASRYSTDYGNTWKAISLPDSIALFHYSYNSTDQKGNIYWSLFDRTSRYNTITKTVQEISIPIASVSNLLINKNSTIFSQGMEFFSLSTNKGQSWNTSARLGGYLYGGDFQSFTLDSSGGIIATGNTYPFTPNTVFRSSDSGNSWKVTHLDSLQANPNAQNFVKILTAPNGDIFLISSKFPSAFRSSDLGTSWIADTSGLPAQSHLLSDIACDNEGVLYVSSDQNIYRSTNNGNSWQFMINIIDPYLFKHIVTTSLISCMARTSKGEIFAGTTHDGVIMSNDQGATWKVVNEHLDSAHISALFAAPNGDVFGISKGGSLKDGIIYLPYKGNHWYNANDGLGYTGDLTTMAFASDGTAYLGTNGRGVWRSQGSVNEVHSSTINTNKITLCISPNPTSSNATLTYSLPTREFVKIELCDALGRKLTTFIKNIQDAGEHSVNVKLPNLASEIYFVKLSTPTSSVTEKIIIAK